MLEIAYYGALRVSELAGLTWSQVIPRETGEAQLAIVGKGDKPRNILVPADLAAALYEIRGNASGSALVFPITERRINYIVKATAKRAGSTSQSRPTGCVMPTPVTRLTRARPSEDVAAGSKGLQVTAAGAENIGGRPCDGFTIVEATEEATTKWKV